MQSRGLIYDESELYKLCWKGWTKPTVQAEDASLVVKKQKRFEFLDSSLAVGWEAQSSRRGSDLSMRRLMHLIWVPAGSLPGEVFQAFHTWWRPPEDQNILERLFLPAGPEESQDSHLKAGWISREEGSLGLSAEANAPTTQPCISSSGWMEGRT